MTFHAAWADMAKVGRLYTNRVFLYEGKPIESMKTAYQTALRNAEIADLRFHDLRHCAASNLRRAGVDTVTAMRIVGHKSEKMHKRYNSLSEADLTIAANKLNTYASADHHEADPAPVHPLPRATRIGQRAGE
jgi:integrase